MLLNAVRQWFIYKFVSLGRYKMKRMFKAFGITALVTVIAVLMDGCALEEGIELGNYGGSSLSDAYHLTEGEWTFGYISSESDSRWYSVPVAKDNKIYISMYYRKKDSTMTDVAYNLYRETGVKYSGGPYVGDYIFTPDITGKWYIEVISSYGSIGAFAIIYKNNDKDPPNPNFWD